MFLIILLVESIISQLCFRYVEDVKIRCFCPAAEMVPAVDAVDPNRSYELNDFTYVVVLEVKKDAQRLLVGMKSENVPEETR